MRVLVCGGRWFGVVDPNAVDREADIARAAREQTHLECTLTELHAKTPITCIIDDGAKGADTLAFRWASTGNRAGTETYEADWGGRGRRAGPERNARMLEKGRPDLVVAFPGGKGTADMVRRAKAAGVRVIEVEPQNEACTANLPSTSDKPGSPA